MATYRNLGFNFYEIIYSESEIEKKFFYICEYYKDCDSNADYNFLDDNDTDYYYICAKHLRNVMKEVMKNEII